MARTGRKVPDFPRQIVIQINITFYLFILTLSRQGGTLPVQVLKFCAHGLTNEILDMIRNKWNYRGLLTMEPNGLKAGDFDELMAAMETLSPG